MLIGAHVSIAGGLDKAISNGERVGANAIQTFAASPRSLTAAKVEPEVIQAYLKKRAASQIKYHVFHGSYLINLAHENEAYAQSCAGALITCQQLAGEAGVAGTCFHVGSHKGKGLSRYLTQIAVAIKRVVAESPEGVWLLLENAAGQKGTIGVNFDEIEQIFARVEAMGGKTKYLGITMDTQHAFASGFPLDKEGGIDILLAEIEVKLGLDRLKLVHVNDSLVPGGSARDRHANIGEGLIGIKGLAAVVNHPKLKALPFILEVPGKDKHGPEKDDVDKLKALLAS